jgi:hypothetical protein
MTPPVPAVVPPQADLDRAKQAGDRTWARLLADSGPWPPELTDLTELIEVVGRLAGEVYLGAGWATFVHTISAWHREDGR